MLVGIINQTAPSGKIKVRQFRNGASTAAAVQSFVDDHPGEVVGDWLGYDTTTLWPSGYEAPAAGNQWSYDFDTPGLVETLIPIMNNEPWQLESVFLGGHTLGYAAADDSGSTLRTSGMYDEQMFDSSSSSGALSSASICL